MLSDTPQIEIRSYKWPKRATTVSKVRVLDEDEHGLWLGAKQGDPWRSADGKHHGVYEHSLVKLVPKHAYWAACFHPVDPVVDVDIVLPLQWIDGCLEEVDLELDVLRKTDGSVSVRDEDEFDRVKTQWAMPDDIVERAVSTCEEIRQMLIAGKHEWIGAGADRLASFL